MNLVNIDEDHTINTDHVIKLTDTGGKGAPYQKTSITLSNDDVIIVWRPRSEVIQILEGKLHV